MLSVDRVIPQMGHSTTPIGHRQWLRVEVAPKELESKGCSSLLGPHRGRHIYSGTLSPTTLSSTGTLCLKIIDFDVAMRVKDEDEDEEAGLLLDGARDLRRTQGTVRSKPIDGACRAYSFFFTS